MKQAANGLPKNSNVCPFSVIYISLGITSSMLAFNRKGRIKNWKCASYSLMHLHMSDQCLPKSDVRTSSCLPVNCVNRDKECLCGKERKAT
jgi:hypothetical protein